MDSKLVLRNKYKSLRKELSEEIRDELSLQIANKLLELDIWDRTYYHIFLPITSQNEIDTEYILHILQGRDKSIVIPKADFNSGSMAHYLLQENTQMELSEYGIPEPVEGIRIEPSFLEVVFLPLLAFDDAGNRLGYGKGFYDRFLSNCNKDCLFIGLSFFESEAAIPSNSKDIMLHYCATPTKLYTFK